MIIACPACATRGPHHRCRTGTCLHCDACGHGYHPRPVALPTTGKGWAQLWHDLAAVLNRRNVATGGRRPELARRQVAAVRRQHAAMERWAAEEPSPRVILTDGEGRPIEGDAVADVANRAFADQLRRSLRQGARS